MSHLFIHAPPGNGADGIVLWHDEKPGFWLEHEVEDLCRRLFYKHDYRDLLIHKNRTATKPMVTQYQLWIHQGFMSRYTAEDSFEQIGRDSWLKVYRRIYPELGRLIAFSLEAFELEPPKRGPLGVV